ncbi:MAG: TetR/AcrR family transcriptional regulator [Tannerella sp.]|jgi:AcrR family transcriptional regulator|nr:TetR/AcrR family transcriptional regulator [Tannerella sp.]
MFNSDNYTEVQQRIVESARELFVKKGLKRTTVRDIANAAGTNVAMVNYYFRSKDNLFETIFEEAFSILTKRIFFIMNSDLPFFETIRAWVYSYYDTLMEYPNMPIFVLTELSQNPDKLKEKFHLRYPNQLYDKVAERIQKETENGTIREISVSDFFLNILSLSVFPFVGTPMVTQFFNLSEEQYMEQLGRHREHVVDFIIRAIKKDE